MNSKLIVGFLMGIAATLLLGALFMGGMMRGGGMMRQDNMMQDNMMQDNMMKNQGSSELIPSPSVEGTHVSDSESSASSS